MIRILSHCGTEVQVIWFLCTPIATSKSTNAFIYSASLLLCEMNNLCGLFSIFLYLPFGILVFLLHIFPMVCCIYFCIYSFSLQISFFPSQTQPYDCSDNYYSSVATLNEMGAAWVMRCKWTGLFCQVLYLIHLQTRTR